MKNHLFSQTLLVSTLLFSCVSNSQTTQSIEDSVFIHEMDETSLTETESDNFTDQTELSIYDLFILNMENKVVYFVPLSDMYPFGEDPDSPVIEQQYLGNTAVEKENLHTLNAKNRKRFLNRVHISAKDKIFIYDIFNDQLTILDVKESPVIAYLSPYGFDSATREYDYMIGFELITDQLSDNYQSNQFFVSIGSSSPFNLGQQKQITWRPLDHDLFPNPNDTSKKALWFKNLARGECFLFSNDGLYYFLQNLTNNNITYARHLVVIGPSAKMLFNSYYSESEGSGLAPITIENEANEYPSYQWTGSIFKNKPPIIFGFVYLSFSCPSIEFIGNEVSPITIHCDNRH